MKSKLVLIICMMCMTVTVGAAGIIVMSTQNKQEQEQEAVNDVMAELPPSGASIEIKDDNRNYAAEIQDKVQRGRILVKMTSNWVFEDGGAKSNAYLANSERNSYPLRFEITLADTGEVIMTSPDVPIGSCIENFPLSVTLEPGEYEVVIAHQQVENGEIFNAVRTAGTIIVK